jgi:hypothetical protein
MSQGSPNGIELAAADRSAFAKMSADRTPVRRPFSACGIVLLAADSQRNDEIAVQQWERSVPAFRAGWLSPTASVAARSPTSLIAFRDPKNAMSELLDPH